MPRKIKPLLGSFIHEEHAQRKHFEDFVYAPPALNAGAGMQGVRGAVSEESNCKNA